MATNIEQGWHENSDFKCPECSGITVTEDKRGWWCTNPKCKLRKKRADIRKRDKYRPNIVYRDPNPKDPVLLGYKGSDDYFVGPLVAGVHFPLRPI